MGLSGAFFMLAAIASWRGHPVRQRTSGSGLKFGAAAQAWYDRHAATL